MAKLKKKAGTSSSAQSAKPDTKAQAERFTRTLSESAQQIWMAGVGAFGRAQAEGAKLFEALVKEGMTLEQNARKLAGNSADVVRDAVENRAGQAKERATDTWDRLEKVFEDRVQRAMGKLGVPSKDDLSDLSHRVDRLTAELRRQGGAAATPARKTASKAAPAKKAAPRKKAASTAPATAKKAAPARKAAAPRKTRQTAASKATPATQD